MFTLRRQDGRSENELRPVQIELGQLDRADGSGRFGFGATAALASFAGPIEVRPREEMPTRATMEVTHRPLEGVAATPSRALVKTLESILAALVRTDHHPRSLLQLVVQSLSASTQPPSSGAYPANPAASTSHTWPPTQRPSTADNGDGGDDDPADDYTTDKWELSESETAPLSGSGTTFSARAAAINAASLALLDAGSVAMRGVPVAVALALLPSAQHANADRQTNHIQSEPGVSRGEGGTVVLDPTAGEEARAVARFGFGWAFGDGLAHGRQSASAPASQTMEVDGGAVERAGQAGEGQGDAELVWAEAEGRFTKTQYDQALALSRDATRQVLAAIRRRLEEHFTSATT